VDTHQSAKERLEILVKMRKPFGYLLIVYGLSMSTYFRWWCLRDNSALEDAVRRQRPQIELRHRINVGFEGVWFLLSNFIVIAGAAMLLKNRDK